MRPSERIYQDTMDAWKMFPWWEKIFISKQGVALLMVMKYLDEQAQKEEGR